MDLSFQTISLFLTIFITGLSAGLFYAWQVSVIPGTKQLSDKSYLEAMKSINRTILNPAFFIIFFGSLLFLLISTYLQYQEAVDITFSLLLGATVTYVLGTFAVTAFGNVPLNDALEKVNLSELSNSDLHDTREAYEKKWNQFHVIRTIFSVLAFVQCLMVLFTEKLQITIN
ncbi:MAG: DUF1772 domain-containing protein [Muriicola sp.]|nr:DUF1772 domain-containing protein [Muriicola sp.]